MEHGLITVPSDLAYGKTGAPMGGIGPNEVLQFKVHLIAITKKPSADSASKK